jgi:CRP-like cAMP-binding protein
MIDGTPSELRDDLVRLLGKKQVLDRVIDLVRYAADASPYRLLPKVVAMPRKAARAGLDSEAIVATALERRPVVLSDKEEKLYRVAFSSIDKREFLNFVSLARWIDCSPGEVILEKGQHISEAIVVIARELEVILSGNSRMALRPGQLIGDVSAYSGLASPADVVARGPGTLAKWDLRHVREFTASRPELRASLLRIVSMDLAAKLREIATASPSLAAEKLVPK